MISTPPKETVSVDKNPERLPDPYLISNLVPFELLLIKGANIEHTDVEGSNALTEAIVRDQMETASFLLKNKATLNPQDSSSRTPLDLAVCLGREDMVELLLDNGADMERVDNQGIRSIDRAIGFGDSSVVAIFLRRGAKIGSATWIIAENKPNIQLILLNKLLEDGNTLFRKHKFQDASHRYTYALQHLPVAQNSQTFAQLRVNLLLNYSRCERRLGRLPAALSACTEAVHGLKAGHVSEAGQILPEVLAARAKCLRLGGRLEEALADLEEAQRFSPSSGTIRRAIAKTRSEIVQGADKVELCPLATAETHTVSDSI